jgi:hypothetical protein
MTSIFEDKAIMPNEEMTAAALGGASHIWDAIKSHVLTHYENITFEWKFANKKSGWALTIRKKSRVLFYFVPGNGYFRLVMIFGGKALEAIAQTSLPGHIAGMIADATVCAAGHTCYIDVQQEADIEPILALIKIKDEI